MAEIAIPLLTLGALYLISNEKENKKEGFVTESTANNSNKYANNRVVSNNNCAGANSPRCSLKNPGKYNNANQTTDKFFSKNVSSSVNANNPRDSVGGGIKPQMSLNGNPINTDDFKHNNMVPFFGAKIRGATVDANSSESRLDNLQGAGSQQIRKTEQAPLFQPHKNLQYSHGAPNMNDFMMSRVNPSMKMSNVKPWQEEMVPPGLNKGYNNNSGSGFNSGMDSQANWKPKSVDELRVKTNPKVTYNLTGHQGPALAPVMEPASIKTQGKVEKNRVEKCFDLGPDRWFTTTGLENAPTVRSTEVLQNVNRPDTTCEYYGTSNVANGEATYVTGEYEDPKRPVLQATSVTNLSAKGQNSAREGDYGASSYNLMANNRNTTKHQLEYGVSNTIKAMFAPVLDILRPTRKENVIGSARPNGNVQSSQSGPVIYNPADRLKTTIKETTEGKLDCNHLNVENQGAHAYLVSQQQPVDVQRDSTNCSYLGNAGPGENGFTTNYDAAYRQRNNPNKTYENRPNQGGTQIFNQQENISIKKLDMDRNNYQEILQTGGPSLIPSKDTFGKLNGPSYTPDCAISDERMNPDLLQAFKQNPYTQSLHSV